MQALLSTGAIGPGIATLTVVAKCALTGSLTWLLSVPAIGRALDLILSIGTALGLIETGAVLLIEIRLVSPGELLTVVLRRISAAVVVLRLIVFLVEIRRGYIALASCVVEVVGAVIVVVYVVPIDVVGVYAVPIDVVHVHVVDVPVVVVVAVYKGIGIRYVHVAVVDNG